MSLTPLISVCIPSYNNEDHIGCTLDSVLQQTCGDFEVIITDDRSTDGTVSVIKNFADPRIKLVQNEINLGIGANWNKAMSLATGKYVKVLCGDDLLYPDCLSHQTQALEAHYDSRVVLAICGSDIINANNEIVIRRRSRFGTGQVDGWKLIRKCVWWGTNLIGEPAVGLFNRDILVKSGMFDPSNPYLVDLDFWARLLKHGDAFADQSHRAAFRISEGSVSTNIGLKQAAGFRKFVREIHSDPAYRITGFDVTTGYILSLLWCVLRNLLINWHAKKCYKKSSRN